MILVSVVNVDSLSVIAKVDELVVHLIRREQPAVIHFDAFPELELAEQVQYISSQAAFEGTTPYFEIKVDILDPVSSAEDPKLRLGMSADVTITTVDRKDVLKIPLEALQGSEGDYYVWHQVDQPTGLVLSKRKVSIGVRDSRWVQIIAGLRESDTILY